MSVYFHIVPACSCPISKEKTGTYGCCLFSIFACWSVERRLLLQQVRQTPGSLVMRRSPKLFVHVVRSSEDDASNCQFVRKLFLPSILLWKWHLNQPLPIPPQKNPTEVHQGKVFLLNRGSLLKEICRKEEHGMQIKFQKYEKIYGAMLGAPSDQLHTNSNFLVINCTFRHKSSPNCG